MREVARRSLRICAAVATAMLALPAQDDALVRMVTADASRFLTHSDPLVRGEAALVVASQKDPSRHEAVLAIARDDDEAARLRGILALGLQGTPGVTLLLDDILSDQAHRTEPAGLCAAFALGSLPPDQAPAVVARTLTSFADGNWRRQSEVLHAMLCGMRRQDQRMQLTALRTLYAERSNRDEALRCQLLAMLLPIDPDWTKERVLKTLGDGSEAERQIVLDWLATGATAFDADLAAPAERLAARSSVPETRARALALLTRLRHPPAIELAVRALRSSNPIEIRQGMRSALTIGGSAMRLALERHVRECRDQKALAGMLRAWATPPSAELADLCAELARDRSAPIDARIAAAAVLARSDATRANPLLRDLFRTAAAADPENLLATAIVRSSDAPLPLLRLLPDPPEPALHPAHWRALLAAGHPEASRALLRLLESATPDKAQLVAGLQAWRLALVLGPANLPTANLPDGLREVLLPTH